MLRFEWNIPEEAFADIRYIFAVSVPLVMILSVIIGCYKDLWRYAGFDAMFRQGILAMINIAVLLAVKYLFISSISGSIAVLYGILLFILTSGVRIVSRAAVWARFALTAKTGKRRAVIVGAGETGAMLVKRARESNSEDSFLPVAIADNDTNKRGLYLNGIKIAGTLDEIEDICNAYKAGEIIVALPNANKEELYDIYKKCINTSLPIKTSQNLLDVHNVLRENELALKLVTIEDLLFRDVVDNDMTAVREYIKDRTVMVTGGAGSIGSELCRQLLDCGCGMLIIYDFNENGLYDIDEEFREKYDKGRYALCLGSIRDTSRLQTVIGRYKPYIVYHAAAHKHVPMLELNPFEAVKNNVIGTRNVIEACIDNKVQKFILISTDKAVNPANILGASKRAAEMLVEQLGGNGTQLAAVRFGNVLGSIGSVIPKFKRQIAEGGPVTVTDENITRYFMTISEAVGLVLTAGVLAKNGELFVLDMGIPVRIYDLAADLIRLSGYKPGEDIKIEITGLRPGEKLYEELFCNDDKIDSTSHEKLFILRRNDRLDNAAGQGLAEGYERLAKKAYEGRDEESLRDELFAFINGRKPG